MPTQPDHQSDAPAMRRVTTSIIRPLRNLSIRGRIMLLVGMIDGVIVLFMILYFPWLAERAAVEHLEDKANSIVRMTAFNLGAPVFFDDSAGVYEALDAARQNRDLVSISVSARDRHVVHWTTPAAHTGMLTASSAIEVNGVVIGHVVVGLSLQQMEADVRESRVTTALVSLLLFGISMLLATVISALITRPIQSVVETVRAISDGDLTPRARVHGDDDIGRLARVFNAMIDGLADATTKLAAFNQTLEQRVLDGTRELRVEIAERRKAEDALREASSRLRTLSRRLLEVQEAERRHLARELHDEIGQTLTVLKMSLGAVQHGATSIDESIRIVEDLVAQIRTLSSQLHPTILDDLGLTAAVRWHVDRISRVSGIDAQVLSDIRSRRYSPAIESACFRIVQEALTNVIRHADATHVRIHLREEADTLVAVVADNGCGFDVDAQRERALAEGSLGLIGMEERALLAGGTLECDSLPGDGATITARFPIGQSPTPSTL